MSTFAAARVETKIVLQGEGNAAKAVADVRRELAGLGEGAAKAASSTQAVGAGLTDFAKQGTQTVQRSGAAFAGLASVLGGSVVPELAKAGQGLTAAGAAANILPGPIGLAAAGVAALTIGAIELAKHFAETAAKVKELGDSGTQALADRLHVSVDEAIKLQQALEELPSALRPTSGLLDVVRQRAESMGKDGGAAVVKLTEALGKGPEAVKAFELEFGRLAAVSAKLPDVAARLGLSQAALGIAQAVGDEGERAKAAAERAVTLERERAGLLAASEETYKRATTAALDRSIQLGKQADSLQRQAGLFDGLVQAAVDEANALQQVVDRQRDAEAAAKSRAEVGNTLSAEIAVFEAQAGAQLDKQNALRFSLHASQLRQNELARKQVELEVAHNKGLLTELQFRQDVAALQAEGFKLAAADVALGKQAKADLDAKRQKARQALEAELAAKIRLAKVDADRIEASVSPGATAARLRQLALEEQAEVGKAAREVNTAKGRETAIAAIRQEFAAKRLALDVAIGANEAKLAEDNLAALQAGNAKSLELQAKLAEVTAQTAAKSRASLAAKLRESGKDTEADLVEQRQAYVDYTAEVQKANDALQQGVASTVAGSEDRFAVEKINLEASAQAWQDYNDKLGQIDKQAQQRMRSAIEAAAEVIKIPAGLIAGSGGAGAKLGKALQTTADGVQQVSRNWKGMRASAPDAISAVGGVAAALVDGERQKAAILAVTEAAAAVASYPNVPAMLAHGAAAVLYGSVAAGVVGGGGGVPSVPSAGDLAGGGAGAAGGGTGTGGQVVNVYFGRGVVMGTPQQVGVAVQGAVGSLKGSGLKSAKGI